MVTDKKAPLVEVMASLGMGGESWKAWQCLAKVQDAMPLNRDEQEMFEACTGRSRPPSEPPGETLVIKGRRCGGSRYGSARAIRAAAFVRYDGRLALGERAVVALAASDREQARVLLEYATSPFSENGLHDLVQRPSKWQRLKDLVNRETRWGIDLVTRVSIEVRTAHLGTIRGRTYAEVIGDEIAFWSREDGSNPASEVLNAARPGLITLNGQLHMSTTPFGPTGPAWDLHQKYWGKDDGAVLVWKAASRTMNPLIPERVVLDALERDEAVAKAEWLGEFRQDVEGFVNRSQIAAVVIPGRTELPPRLGEGGDYLGFVDAADGAGKDSFALGISHIERYEDGGGHVIVLDCVQEVKPPFNPRLAVQTFSGTLRRYAIGTVFGDRVAKSWVADTFEGEAIDFRVCPLSKSELYLHFLPLITSRTVELLDHARLLEQLHGLQRRAGSSGHEAIDHRGSGHDDVVNSAAGACVLAHREASRPALMII